MVASWLRAKPFSLSKIACARILVRQFGSVLWISLRRKRSSSVKGATNLVAVLIVGIVPENFCFATYRVYIRYTTARCEGNTPVNWDVPIGTVHLIDVLPKTRVSLSTLNVNLDQFEVAEVKDVAGARIYNDGDNGFEFEYFEKSDTITRLSYFPSNKDSHLQCQKR